jgi:PAS domain S-box-containing protein
MLRAYEMKRENIRPSSEEPEIASKPGKGTEETQSNPNAVENEIHNSGIDVELNVSDILEALPFYVMLVDEQHHILQANNAVREHLGLKPEDIVGRYCPEVVHGLKEPWYACPLEEAVEKGQAVEREALDEKSGRWIKSAIYPTRKFTRSLSG